MKKNISLNRQLNFRLICLCLLVIFSSCTPRNLVYFSDLPKNAESNTPITNYAPPKIQPDDILSITVSSLNPESNVLFNNVLLPTTTGNTQVIADKIDEGYLVDKDGFINFPVIGKIELKNLTKEQATEKMTGLIKEHVKNPIVNIRFINFKVTVIGEVADPATFTVPTEKINILEALGLAGDMTAYGRRESVLIIREKNGVRSTARVNLNNKDVLTSPYFYLQQNDIVYVEPNNKVKTADTAPGNRLIGIWAALITTAGFVLIAIY
ncbi:MAG TPA: polysaccharide biosynthesis/export family protein [Chryseolinea sp.]